MDVRLNQPSLAVRLHRNCPEEFLLKVCELSRLGTGFPAIHNDEVGIKALLRKGVTTEEARDWCLVGCVEPNLPGKLHQWSDYGHYNFGSAVEFALFNGEHLLSGRKLGPRDRRPERRSRRFEEFEAAVMAQLAEQLRHIAIQGHVTEALHRELLPCPLASALMLDCIDNGADLLRGGARYKRGPGTLGIGLSDGANSLAAVKKLVYDEKRLTMDELREALRADFEGHEEVRDLCLAAPKYGNDDDEVDQYVRHFAHLVVTEHEKYATLTGGKMMPSWYPVSSNVPQGMTVAALPSGRKAGKPLADGVSPNQGTDRLGPTAVLRSVGKFQHEDLDGGTLLNVKFEPQVVAGDEGCSASPPTCAASSTCPSTTSSSTWWRRRRCAARRPSPTSTARCWCASPATPPSSWSCTRTSRTTSSRARPTPRLSGEPSSTAPVEPAAGIDAGAGQPRVSGRVFDVQRFSLHDGPGIRTVVFLKGCPLRCAWCANPESQRPGPQIAWFENLCAGCGRCAEACPHGAVRMDEGRVRTDRRLLRGLRRVRRRVLARGAAPHGP